MSVPIKVIVGNRKYPMHMTKKGDRINLSFGYNPKLIEIIKTRFEGAKWHPDHKIWSIAASEHNSFQLHHLMGNNPYAPYERELVEAFPTRKVMKHQYEMIQHALTYKRVILACEMGTGKTLVAIEVMEIINSITEDEAWYVGPVAGVKAVSRELRKWKSKARPLMLTYDGFRKHVENWREGDPAPRILIVDESSKIMNPKAKRSQAVNHVCVAMRKEWGDDCYIILMTGTPAPRSPENWWNQCHVTCPGFLFEPDIYKFKGRLCLIEQVESVSGGVFPKIITWFDDERKCKVCGQLKDHENHILREDAFFTNNNYHQFEKSVNHVERLYKRMQGLTIVKWKKDCLDLPEKQFRVIRIKPSPDTIRAARAIKQLARNTITAMTKLRELSDGFQYYENEIGREQCSECHGRGETLQKVPVEQPDLMNPENLSVENFTEETLPCPNCGGEGTIAIYSRQVETVNSPKDKVLIDLLDEAEEHGRFIVWGAFEGTIDKCVDICHSQGWAVLRIDGRGYQATNFKGEILNSDELLDAMDLSHPNYKALLEKYPKVVSVGHPKAGGMALTLTASPVSFNYSVDYDGEARMQSIERGHRPGMDINKGHTIIDCVHLPIDQLILDNLEKKVSLQKLTMGDIDRSLNQEFESYDY